MKDLNVSVSKTKADLVLGWLSVFAVLQLYRPEGSATLVLDLESARCGSPGNVFLRSLSEDANHGCPQELNEVSTKLDQTVGARFQKLVRNRGQVFVQHGLVGKTAPRYAVSIIK